jgi:hypothetical protein
MTVNMDEKQVFILAHAEARRRAVSCVGTAPDGFKVTVQPAKRTDEQNARFHAMVGDVARQCLWHGKKRSPLQWKVLFVSAHAVLTGEGAEMLPGLENEYVNIRESTAQMSIKRGASLIEYVRSWGDDHGVRWTEPVAELAR